MEKIRDELLKIILTYHAPRAYRLMQSNDILSYIMPNAQYIDNLEFFNTIAKGQKIKNEEIVKLFILYRPNDIWAENMSVRLKLNRGQKNLLLALSNPEIKFEDLLTPLGRLNLIYRYGKDFCQAFLLTSYAELMKAPDDLWKIYDAISNFAKPKFPITGKDLMDLGISNNRQIGNLIKELEKRWIEAGFSLSKKQLLAQFREVI
jgi:poly(A) polymerase